MPTDYENMALSKKQILCFSVVIAGAGMGIGYLFFNKVIAGIACTAFLTLTLPMYKKSVSANVKSALLVQFRDMLYSVSASFSVGRNMCQALDESIEFWQSTYTDDDYIMKEMKYMVNSIKSANEKDTAVLSDFARRSGLSDISDFVNIYEIVKETGGDVPKAISRATNIIGDKISLEKELKTTLSQKLFEGRIVALSPVLMVAFLRLSSPDYLDPLLNTRSGNMITFFSLGLMAFAIVLIERINKIEV